MEVSLKPAPAWNSALDARHKATRQTPVLAIVFSKEALRMDRTRLPHLRGLSRQRRANGGPKCQLQLSAGPGMKEPYADQRTQRWKRRNIQSPPRC